MHQGSDGVQRVQQKVRMQLHAQHLQASLGQPGFQLLGANLSISIFLEIPKSVSDPCQQPANQKIAEEISDHTHLKKYAKRQKLRLRTVNELDDRIVHGQLDQSEANAGGDVNRQTVQPVVGLQRQE